jgi:hypothetical protein
MWTDASSRWHYRPGPADIRCSRVGLRCKQRLEVTLPVIAERSGWVEVMTSNGERWVCPICRRDDDEPIR